MAFEIVWTQRATDGYSDIIDYLEVNWTEKEIRNFIKETERVLGLIKQHPEIFQKSIKHKTLHRGVIHGLTVFTYRVIVNTRQIQLVNLEQQGAGHCEFTCRIAGILQFDS